MNAIYAVNGYDKMNCTWKRYFKFVGIDFDSEVETPQMHLLKVISLTLNILFIYQFATYIIYKDLDIFERSYAISSISFCLSTLGRMVTLIKGKKEIVHCLDQFRKIFPNDMLVQHYSLQHFIAQYQKVVLCFKFLMHTSMLAFWLAPILTGFVHFIFGDAEKIEFPILFDFYYPFSIYESWWLFLTVYSLQVLMSYCLAFTIISCDLCLLSLLTQLCIQYDLIGQRIREIDASKENADQELKKQINYHQYILNLCDDVNRIFAPFLTLEMLSSCFVLCFTGYQLLEDLPVEIIIRALFVLAYELKQVAVICYYGEKLIKNSENLFDQLYEHNWFDGSTRYKRLVLFTMRRTLQPSALNIGKIWKLNLQTLQFIFNNSYQAFTVLKSSK